MTKKIINWGILGTSFISEVMAKAIQESKTSRLLAIASRSSHKAKTFSDKFTIPKYFDDYQTLLNDPAIDAIYIGLPNHLHKDWITHSALAKKHILCEKPLVVSIDEAREVIATINQADVFCMEALMYQCHPLINKLKELIQNKMIGEIKLYNAIYSANIAALANPTAGGSIRNLGCYPISLIRLLAMAEPIEILASGRMNKNQNDNQASVILKFPDQSMAMVTTADDIEMFWQFDIYGTEGHLKIVSNPWLPTSDDNKIIISRHMEKNPIEINVKAEQSLYTYQIDVVNQNILGKKQENGIPLLSSLGNTIVLETWLQQVKEKNTRSTVLPN